MNLPLIPLDKANHALWTAMMAVVVMMVLSSIGETKQYVLLGAGIASVLVAIGKEVIDFLGYGTCDAKDAFASILGYVLVAIPYWMGQ